MGDARPPSSSSNAYPGRDSRGQAFQGHPIVESQAQYPHGNNMGGNSPFQPQYHQQYGSPQSGYPPYEFSQSTSSNRLDSFDMTTMANSLAQTGYASPYNANNQSRYNAVNVGARGGMGPYAGQAGMPMAGGPFYQSHQTQMPPYYAGQSAQQQGSLGSRPNMAYYPNQPLMNHPPQQMPTVQPYYYSSPMPPQVFIPQDPRAASKPPRSTDHSAVSPGAVSTEDSRSSVVRGPPRKPRQSGHAIWIGNLPPQTDLMSLVNHVCKEAKGLESLFLISKSNCAFANFKDEESCIQAQQKLHDSKFQTVRLVSRLRKSTVEGAAGRTAPTGPAITSPVGHTASMEPTSAPPRPPSTTTEENPPDLGADDATPKTDPEAERSPLEVVTNEYIARKDKFFILKSLTVEDLDLSVRNGVWATQSHNEGALNAAFKDADNVYLVFSANKSGEYYGYARMTSPINDDPAAAIEFAPKVQATTDLDVPKAIPTEPTEHCPRGNIIDDSARGTIFWEIERDDDDETASEDSTGGLAIQDGENGSKVWGKPFKLEWLSTARLPFYRTRGLRNPWNSNREVKIARDGTDLEPSIGRKLIGLFNRVQSPTAPGPMGTHPGMAAMMAAQAVGYPTGMGPGFAPPMP